MPVDRSAPLPKEVYQTVTQWIDGLTEELKTKFDFGFQPGIYIVHTTDENCLPDGIWVLFSPNTPAELALGLVEAGHCTLENFMTAGLKDKLESLHESRRNRA
jgi:hypothetical protein